MRREEQIYKSLESTFARCLGSFDRQRSRHLTLGLVVLKYSLDNDPKPPAGQVWPTDLDEGAQPVGAIIDALIANLEAARPALRGLFPLGYAAECVDQFHLGQTVAELAAIDLRNPSPGNFDAVGQLHERVLIGDQLRSTERSSEDIENMISRFRIGNPEAK